MTNRFRTGILLVLVAFLGYLAYLIMEPFFVPLTWVAVFANSEGMEAVHAARDNKSNSYAESKRGSQV